MVAVHDRDNKTYEEISNKTELGWEGYEKADKGA